ELRSFDSGKKLGYIVIDVDPTVIHQILSQVTLGGGESLYIADRSGHMVAGKEGSGPLQHMESLGAADSPEGVTHAVLDGERLLVAYVASTVTNWTTVGIVPVSELMKDTILIRNSITLFGILCVGLAM